MISFDELANAPDLSLKGQVDAFFDGTKYICGFADNAMIPLLKGLLQPSPNELAIMSTYFRMCLLLRSIVTLNSLPHLQSVASATRSLFELWLDIKILATDSSCDATQKFHAFPEIERYRAAEQLIKFAETNPNFDVGLSNEKEFYDNQERKQRIASFTKKDKNDKIIYPQHWTDTSVRQRAIKVNCEDWYVEAYPLLSWHIHAGVAGTSGISKEGLEACFGFCHSLVQRIFINATSTCAKVTRISDAIDYFNKWMESLRLKTGELIVDEQIKLLDKAKRLHATK